MRGEEYLKAKLFFIGSHIFDRSIDTQIIKFNS
jgi:hypothetical protein